MQIFLLLQHIKLQFMILSILLSNQVMFLENPKKIADEEKKYF